MAVTNSRPQQTRARSPKKRTQKARSQSKSSLKGSANDLLNSISKPGFVKDSIKSIGNLRSFCKQCLKYIGEADQMLDTLYLTSNTLSETGLLQKVMKSKGKDLSSGDLATLLMALMNTPLADRFLGKSPGQSDSGSSSTPPPSQQNSQPSTQVQPQPQTFPPHQQSQQQFSAPYQQMPAYRQMPGYQQGMAPGFQGGAPQYQQPMTPYQNPTPYNGPPQYPQ